MKVRTQFGDYDVEIRTRKYVNNKNLAIQLVEPDGMPFAMLTVNLGRKLSPDLAYVDTNNCPWAEEFIEENELGVPTDRIGQSGWCFYPEYKFNLEKIGGAND